MITDRIGLFSVLLPINQNYSTEREKLDVTYTFLLQKQQLTEQNARQQDA